MGTLGHRFRLSMPDSLAGDRSLHVQSVAPLENLVAPKARYRPGRVVDRVWNGVANRYQMTLPTVLDLVDDEFARAHCFTFGGREEREGESWWRLDVQPDDKLNQPDVSGSFWLDSATVELRRMELSLSRPDRLPREYRDISELRVHTRLVPVAPGLAIVGDVCAVTRFQPKKRGEDEPPRLIELQQLTGYLFKQAPDGVEAEGAYAWPAWNAGQLVSSELVWCAGEGGA
jgi:hypothetical protein